jgi:superfamily II DNA helicase RecQ
VRIQVLTLRYHAARGGFDDGPLDELVRARHVLSVSEHFFCVDEVPHLACVVRWQEDGDGADGTRPPAATPGRRKPRPARPDPAADLDAGQRADFEALRAWRRTRARAEGLPAYSLLTDRQIAAIVRARPGSVEALAEIEGVGPGKARLFGQELLGLTAPAGPTKRAATARGDGGA